MTVPELRIDPDIGVAATPPAALYGESWFPEIARRVLARGWHVVANADDVAAPDTALPVTLLPGVLDEPLVLTRDGAGRLRCLANVCTHRGNLVCTQMSSTRRLVCGYHGRTFRLDGSFVAAPGFEDLPSFPTESDSLAAASVATWGPLVFANLTSSADLSLLMRPLDARRRIDSCPLTRDPSATRDYVIDANWAMYVDNYLEGFHVPYVHAGLAQAIELGAYATELFPHAVLQTAVAAPDEPAFEPPPGHPDRGRRIAAYWWWLFPATMLNLYPWGLSVNVVEPLSASRTRVRYSAWVGDASLRGRGAGADLHKVELEDEAVVTGVQRGLRSSLYRGGRYSPRHERGVHHFHRLLAEALAGGDGN